MGGVKKTFKKLTSAIGLGGSKTPKVIERDPQKEAEEAANKAAETANLELAQKKKQRRASSLLSTGGEQGSASSKQTLGG
ncbi:hypothetical protein DM558_01960 [Entomomonas moraniae]|uniref:Uncharacterized protein n=1 Tax=Entomomonas moraniae TaxID=2213226 RepID=A0A3S9XB62_9GAMM|nr:hypothetical protein [Entomomonas moraniae]AZS49616.1 hypothetical protein DM558_01960 [Entomomonas moraniae]